jgi:TPR repeat protein
MMNLGTLYGNGSYGVKQDLVKARKWWSQAAAMGDGLSIRCLAMLEQREAFTTANAKKVPPVEQEKETKKSTYENKNIKPNAKCHCVRFDLIFLFAVFCLIFLWMYIYHALI